MNYNDAVGLLKLDTNDQKKATLIRGEDIQNLSDEDKMLAIRIYKVMAMGFVPDAHFNVAGITFSNEESGFSIPRQSIAKKASMYCKLYSLPEVNLVREPDNPYDPNAVAVYIGVAYNRLTGQWELQKIGYVPKMQDGKPLSEIFSSKMDSGGEILTAVEYILADKNVENASLRCRIAYKFR